MYICSLVQCYGSVTYVCTCVLAGSLLHGPGKQSLRIVDRRGVKLMFVWEFKSIRTRTYRIGIFR